MRQIWIAVVEDEPAIIRLLEINLQAQGFKTWAYSDALTFLKRPPEQQPDLLILDIMMPEMDGIELCRHLRQDPASRGLPILMLTARGEEIDRVVGLEIGADDYMTKPFSLRELIARVRALLRRSRLREAGLGEISPDSQDSFDSQNQGNETDNTKQAFLLRWQTLALDKQSHQASCGNQLLPLSSKEYQLLQALMDHPGWVVTREGLLEKIWGFDFTGETRTVDMHIANLRRKLDQSGGQASWIQTLRGVGYRLSANPDTTSTPASGFTSLPDHRKLPS